jgi:hypothetical protein
VICYLLPLTSREGDLSRTLGRKHIAISLPHFPESSAGKKKLGGQVVGSVTPVLPSHTLTFQGRGSLTSAKLEFQVRGSPTNSSVYEVRGSPTREGDLPPAQTSLCLVRGSFKKRSPSLVGDPLPWWEIPYLL